VAREEEAAAPALRGSRDEEQRHEEEEEEEAAEKEEEEKEEAFRVEAAEAAKLRDEHAAEHIKAMYIEIIYVHVSRERDGLWIDAYIYAYIDTCIHTHTHTHKHTHSRSGQSKRRQGGCKKRQRQACAGPTQA